MHCIGRCYLAVDGGRDIALGFDTSHGTVLVQTNQTTDIHIGLDSIGIQSFTVDIGRHTPCDFNIF